MALLADREGWCRRTGASRKRQGRGGGLEFSTELLPIKARCALIDEGTVAQVGELKATTLPDTVKLPPKGARRFEARALIVRAHGALMTSEGISARQADRALSDLYNETGANLPAWVIATIPSVSERTLRSWRLTAEKEGAEALSADRRGRPSPLETALEGRVKQTILGAIAKKPFLAAKHVRALIAEEFGDELSPIPDLRSFQRALDRWREDHRAELLYLQNPDAYRSTMQFAATSATQAAGLNDLWQIDASPADVMLKGGRHSIYVAIDCWSRRVIVTVTKTPRADAVGLLIRRCITEWGVPNRIKTDNGSDFTAHSMKRLFAALGVTIELSAPYQPQQKGMVERAIGTFQRDLATCPGFIGHSVADRTVIENRKAFSKRLGADPAELFDVEMDAAEFQEWCDGWADKIYGHASHGGLKGKTPFEMAASWSEPIRRVADARALDVLLAPVAGKDGLRKVTKLGVRIDGHQYMTPDVMPGTQVFVRMDPADLGRALLFDEEGIAYLGEAHCPELAGLDPVETIAKVKAAQKAHMADGLRDIRRQMRKIGPTTVSDALMAEGERRAAELVAFPQRVEPHSTPELEAAAEATMADRAAPAPTSGRVTRIGKQPPREDGRARYARWKALHEAATAGEAIDEADAAWMRTYETLPEFNAAKRMEQAFGDRAFGG